MTYLNRQIGLLAGLLVVVMMVAVMREVVGRYFFNAPSAWSLELSTYLLVAVVFLGAAYTLDVGGHIRVDIVYLRLSPRIQVILDIVTSVMAICFLIPLIWQSWDMAWASFQAGTVSGEIARMPLFPSQVVVPIGASLLLIQFGINIACYVGSLRQLGRDKSRREH